MKGPTWVGETLFRLSSDVVITFWIPRLMRVRSLGKPRLGGSIDEPRAERHVFRRTLDSASLSLSSYGSFTKLSLMKSKMNSKGLSAPSLRTLIMTEPMNEAGKKVSEYTRFGRFNYLPRLKMFPVENRLPSASEVNL